MNWDQGTWDSGFWDEPLASDYFHPPKRQPNQHNTMKRQDYYPSRIGDQINWLANFSVKLPVHGTAVGVDSTTVTAAVADAKWAHYVLNLWLSAVRNFAPSSTDAVDDVLEGQGEDAVVLPTFTAPALPSGVTPQLPGVLPRLFTLIAKIKLDSGYTESIGTDLGIVGPEVTEKSMPKFTVTVEQGGGCQCARLVFYKYGHMGVYIESRRGTGAWEFLAIDTESPYEDARPLLAAGQPEVREYRMRFWDKGTPNGEWTPVASITVSP